ncbi:MAG: DUF1772 domain-containing protein [Hyphomicrobiales bacterium]|nr:MAG: DUF1772 domain-containing protein [Hyphomicrobiales bacterium]
MQIFGLAAHALAIMLLGLVTGSMFAIWQGYPIIGYSPSTFVEVHQGAVRGLNAALPAMAAAALVLVTVLAVVARRQPSIMWLFVIIAGLIVAGGLITRFINQPINAQVMTWNAASLPAEWSDIRQYWWTWHQVRLATTAIAQMLLIAAIFVDRKAMT